MDEDVFPEPEVDKSRDVAYAVGYERGAQMGASLVLSGIVIGALAMRILNRRSLR